MSEIAAGRVAEIFVEFADTLVDEFDLVAFLERVTSRVSEVVGAATAGILLADPQGELQFMAASDERTQMLELFQAQSGSGPCHDCFSTGTPVVNADLAQSTLRWPLFAPLAVSVGFRSVHAFPMRLRQEAIGTLSLFGSDAIGMAEEDVRTVQAIADIATIGLLHERAVRRGEELTQQLQGALNSRIVIEQAKGAIAMLHACSVDEAFALLRAHSRQNNLRLGAVAHAVVTDPNSVPELTSV